MTDVKTLDVKIFELREEPDNIPLLISILAYIHNESDMILENGEGIKDFDLVNYVLAKALRADKIKTEDFGMVLAYLVSVNAPDIYWQFAILRVHQNL